MKALQWPKVAKAFVLAPLAASVTFIFEICLAQPLNLPPFMAIVLYVLYGFMVSLGITIVMAVPLFLLFWWRGWLNRSIIFIGAILVSQWLPISIAQIQASDPGVHTSWLEFLAFAVAGIVAAQVFCVVSMFDRGPE